jgi:hypothetical protein
MSVCVCPSFIYGSGQTKIGPFHCHHLASRIDVYEYIFRFDVSMNVARQAQGLSTDNEEKITLIIECYLQSTNKRN